MIALAVAAPQRTWLCRGVRPTCVSGFRVLGYDAQLAAAYALVSHALQYVLFILYGIFLMLKYNVSFSIARCGTR